MSTNLLFFLEVVRHNKAPTPLEVHTATQDPTRNGSPAMVRWQWPFHYAYWSDFKNFVIGSRRRQNNILNGGYDYQDTWSVTPLLALHNFQFSFDTLYILKENRVRLNTLS